MGIVHPAPHTYTLLCEVHPGHTGFLKMLDPGQLYGQKESSELCDGGRRCVEASPQVDARETSPRRAWGKGLEWRGRGTSSRRAAHVCVEDGSSNPGATVSSNGDWRQGWVDYAIAWPGLCGGSSLGERVPDAGGGTPPIGRVGEAPWPPSPNR